LVTHPPDPLPFRIYGDLTPRRVFDLCPPLLLKERGKILKRGASAPLKHPCIINPGQGELKRRVKIPLQNLFSFKTAGTKRELKGGSASNMFIGSSRGTKSLLPCYPLP